MDESKNLANPSRKPLPISCCYPLKTMIKKIIARLKRDPWTYGTYKSLEARLHKNGMMEVFTPRSNPEHSIWIETHPDHWHKFAPKG